ncbi:hypothetical protein BKA67DRAFT_531688 [Truncatella angustata]|uniref:Uncharacterized protein n=1 Tax=Truncatella angustata TaxID=152316 RepID=A0A9P8ZYT5_9PEZI|nr:uncharacterized protein BKA67DRAFT_531688 [Truncatella angustata]KAH6656417.1 hypothetical protein BKA67DRAFT_531688 [Truncatella angustata]
MSELHRDILRRSGWSDAAINFLKSNSIEKAARGILRGDTRERYSHDPSRPAGPSSPFFKELSRTYLPALDYLFFDGQFTSPILPPNENSPKLGQPYVAKNLIVCLEIRIGHDPQHIGAAVYLKNEGKIVLYTHDIPENGANEMSFEETISNLAHEMVHAWNDIFSYDDNKGRRYRHVEATPDSEKGPGHGIIFWELNRFIQKALADLFTWEAVQFEIEATKSDDMYGFMLDQNRDHDEEHELQYKSKFACEEYLGSSDCTTKGFAWI